MVKGLLRKFEKVSIIKATQNFPGYNNVILKNASIPELLKNSEPCSELKL